MLETTNETSCEYVCNQINHIFDKLKITDENKRQEFLKHLLSNPDYQDTFKLKFLYFKLQAELEKMEVVKKRIDIRSLKRTKILLYVLWTILVAQTVWFYHMIFNIDHLGWDLVEPSTYLFQSIVLLLGILSYTKFHRNYMTGSKLLEETTRKMSMKGYMKNNFNHKLYLALSKEMATIKSHLNNKI